MKNSNGALQFKVAVAVTLYKPSEQALARVLSYADRVSRVYIMDNSPEASRELVLALRESTAAEKLVHHVYDENMGVARALNDAVGLAYADGFRWLLTMDQDSGFKYGHIEALLQKTAGFEPKDKIGIFSAYQQPEVKGPPGNPHLYEDSSAVMTTGNLLNLDAHREIGGFDEELFIDTVDHDYCLRLRRAGYGIKRFLKIKVEHELGEPVYTLRRGSFTRIAGHTALRQYYIARNNLRLWKRYYRSEPDFIRQRIAAFFFQLIPNILLFEHDKVKKIKYLLRGTADFFAGRTGKKR